MIALGRKTITTEDTENTEVWALGFFSVISVPPWWIFISLDGPQGPWASSGQALGHPAKTILLEARLRRFNGEL